MIIIFICYEPFKSFQYWNINEIIYLPQNNKVKQIFRNTAKQSVLELTKLNLNYITKCLLTVNNKTTFEIITWTILILKINFL